MYRRLKWWVLTKLHRPFLHRFAQDEAGACWLCRVAWRDVLALQQFVEDLERGRADIAEGRYTRWRDIRHS